MCTVIVNAQPVTSRIEPTMTISTNGAPAATGAVQIGARVRAVREARGMSLRELARRIDVSASFVSQLERGKANPSVGTLYALVSVLGTTLDGIIGDDGSAPPILLSRPRIETPFQAAEGRRRIQMSGVVWERLTHDDDPFVDFLHVEYNPGSASCPEADMMRHGGREYGHVLSGRLEVQVGFETYSMGPGDSIHFDSATPHRLSNPHDEPCRAVWFVLDRRDDDRVPTSTDSAHLPGLL